MATTTPDEPARLARAVVRQLGGRFSVEMGIDVDAGDAEIDRWFLAATLFGTRISTAVAERAFQVLEQAGITRVAEASERSWDELVELLDALGHVGAIAIRARVDARDLEAALVRLALRHRRLAGCPGGHACTAFLHAAGQSG